MPQKAGGTRRAIIAAGIAAVAAVAAGCGAARAGSGSATGPGRPVALRLGFLTNITHAPALVGVAKGFFTKALGTGVTLRIVTFSAGTEEATALLAGQLDAAYV